MRSYTLKTSSILFLLTLTSLTFIVPVKANVAIIPSTIMASIDSDVAIDSNSTLGFGGAYPATLGELGLCFIASTTMNLRQVKFSMVVAAGSPLGTFNALLFAKTGTFGTDCKPTGSSLIISASLVIDSINGDTPFFIFSPYILQAGTTYAISIRLTSCVRCDSNNYWFLKTRMNDASITSNIYAWNNTPYTTVGPHWKLVYEVDGSSIVQFKNQYGNLVVLNNQAYDMFIVYANGTMFFNATGWENFIGTFSFLAQSYGNGTLQLRFKAYQPQQVIQSATTSTYSSSKGYQELTYTTSQTSPLTIIFTNRVDISLINSALMLALFLPAALIALSLKLFGVKQLPGTETPKSYMRKALVLIIIVFIFSLVALIVR